MSAAQFWGFNCRMEVNEHAGCCEAPACMHVLWQEQQQFLSLPSLVARTGARVLVLWDQPTGKATSGDDGVICVCACVCLPLAIVSWLAGSSSSDGAGAAHGTSYGRALCELLLLQVNCLAVRRLGAMAGKGQQANPHTHTSCASMLV